MSTPCVPSPLYRRTRNQELGGCCRNPIPVHFKLRGVLPPNKRKKLSTKSPRRIFVFQLKRSSDDNFLDSRFRDYATRLTPLPPWGYPQEFQKRAKFGNLINYFMWFTDKSYAQ